jgi:ATP-dependent helicase/nuclease subunit A
VQELNDAFTQIFEVNDGSGIRFSLANAARDADADGEKRLSVHVDFVPQTVRARGNDADTMRRKQEAADLRAAVHQKQTDEIVALIRKSLERAEAARARGQKFRIAVLGRTYRTLEPIARALRDAAIPFRAVDLENLGERPEVLDALALARALLNPEDRVAWLGVLRAPWAGLSLADLHTLAGADDPMLLRRPVPELVAARLSLLSAAGRKAAARVMRTMEAAEGLRAAAPSASLGTWLEQVWLQLGGADCVDATGRANVDLLWKCLDELEGGEPDLAGRGLRAAMEKLNAQPDPGASSEYGVQLMSIHKSKGLEFEVVIVPDLQAGCGRGEWGLLSWLERGLEAEDESGDGDITEFLVAPLQPKGAESGKCKSWVDRERRAREAQETRRILYVAATRAREELHLFARPEYKTEQDGSYTLCDPRESLLATAWPALAAEIGRRFDAWSGSPEDFEIAALAASGNVVEMPRPARPAIVRRLPPDYEPPVTHGAAVRGASGAAGPGSSQLYQRHEGGTVSRALGSAVHFLFEELARLRSGYEWAEARAALSAAQARLRTDLRSVGMDPQEAARIADEAMKIAISGSQDAAGEWILSPHPDAASEVRWAGVIEGALHEVRLDRVFRAGPVPLVEGDDCWWIIDYKTADESDRDPQTMGKLRALFAPQLEMYAQVLRNLHGQDVAIRAGLYYPRMLAFDWWGL